jgi:hypothetical protein
MEQYLLIWALILVVGTLIFYVIMKNVLKTIATFLFIILLFVVVTGTLTYSDIHNLQNKLEEMKTAYVFEDAAVVFGIIANNGEYYEIVINANYAEMQEQGEYYKVIVISPDAYEGLHNPEEYIAIIKDSSKTSEERAEAFALLNNAVKSKGVRYILSEYKKENITLYPKTMFFKIIEFVPESWIISSSAE